MKRHLLAAVAAMMFGVAPAAQAAVGFNFDLLFYELFDANTPPTYGTFASVSPHGVTYNGLETQPNTIHLSSVNGGFTAEADFVNNTGGGGTVGYLDFNDFDAELHGIWTLVINQGLATEATYEIEFAFNHDPLDYPQPTITSPTHGSLVSPDTNLLYTGPGIDWEPNTGALWELAGSNHFQEHVTNPTEWDPAFLMTGWTDYSMFISFIRDLDLENVEILSFEQVSGDLNWDLGDISVDSLRIETGDIVNVFVVPEPGTMALLGLAGAGLLLRRRR